MPNLNIPDEGLIVPGPSLQVPDEKPIARTAYPAPFAVKINVTERFLEELSAGKLNSLQLNTGKGRTSLQVGSNQFEFMHTLELFHNELYRQSNDHEVVPLGMLRDKLELLEVVEKKNADADLLALKQQMEALQKQKDKKSVQLVSNPSRLGPELSGRRGLIAAKKAGILTAPSMKTKVNKRTKFSDSMPSSPALTAVTSPAGKDVTSAPKPKSFRKDPLFLPLIHLLALGPEKEQVLAMKTHTDLDKCSGLVIQVANRDVSGRWALFDNMYKELDVWKFKYPRQDMRESAIENAEDAFDRLKLAEDAPEWEMLRKPEDRGKPRPPRQPRRKPEVVVAEPAKKKPVAAASPALPPTIKISKEEPVAASPALGAEPMARSVSQPAGTTGTKARGGAEIAALKKIIGNSNKKGAAKPKANATKGASGREKKTTTTSPSTSSSTILPTKFPPTTTTTATASSKSPNPPASSTPSLTRPKPAPRAKGGAYKSSEFISDSDSSDEDRMLIDTPPVKTSNSSSASSSSSSSAQPLYKKSSKVNLHPERPHNIPSKRPPSVSAVRPEHAATASPPSTNNGHKRTASSSASPAKPSPLGSSPPLTASDIVRQSSTASSSPLSSIATPDDVSTPILDTHTSYTSVPIHTPKPTADKASSKPRYIPEHRDSASPQPKRKTDDSSVARKRVISSTSEDSDGNRKRKSTEDERPMVARKAPKTSQVADATGRTRSTQPEPRRKEVPRVTYASSTASTTSMSSSSSDTSSRGGRSKARYAREDMELLVKYKRLHDDYRTRYEKVRSDPNPPEDRVKQVIDLHNKLAEMKIRIQGTVLAS